MIRSLGRTNHETLKSHRSLKDSSSFKCELSQIHRNFVTSKTFVDYPQRFLDIKNYSTHKQRTKEPPKDTDTSHLRGFGKLKAEDPERLHEIQSKGGHHSHQRTSQKEPE